MPESPPNPETLLCRLEWTVLRRLDGLLHGDYRTLFRGQGVDLAGLREYQYHDDVRHIDWNVTARLQTPHVRVFNEERDIDAWLLLDLSASLNFGSRGQSKRGVLAEFVGLLARMLGRHGNRVGAMVYRNDVERVIPPRSGRRQTLLILQALLQAQEQDQQDAGLTGAGGEDGRGTDLDVLLNTAARAIPRRSLVFVVSDFISTAGWEKTLAKLAVRHEVLVVRLYDEMEMTLPDLGMVTFEDPETGEQLFIDAHDRHFRARYAALADARETQLRNAFRWAGVDALELSTDDTVLDAILRFADLRKQRSRLAAGGTLSSHLENA